MTEPTGVVKHGKGPGAHAAMRGGGGGKGGSKGGAPTYQMAGGGRISRADAAARMFGTGSPQHRRAQAMDAKANAKK